MIKHNIALIFSILFLAACSQNARTGSYYATSGISYEHEIPGNYEFCGINEKNEFGFEMYCYDNFRSMSRCVHDPATKKDYDDCDFQAQITVTIQSETNADGSKNTLESILNDQFPASSVSYYDLKRDAGEVVVAEILMGEQNETAGSPVYLSVLPFGIDHIAIIKGTATDAEQNSKFQKAYEVVVKSFDGFGPRQ